MTKPNGAAAFFRNLVDNGIDTIFACPGTSEMQVVDEIGYSDLRVVLCLFENSVTGMADGYARMLDKPALGMVHVTCGLSNSIASMHNARAANSRMIIYGGGIHAAHEVNEPVHAMMMRQPDMARAAAQCVYEARTPDQLAALATQALEDCNQGAGRVAYVYGPNNAVWGETTYKAELTAGAGLRPRVAAATIESIADSLKAGKKTAFILDGVALREEALEIVGRIAEGTGGTLFREWLPPRIACGAGRVRTVMIPYEPADSMAIFSEFDQAVLVGARIPVAAFSYEGKPWIKLPEGCPVHTLASVDSDIVAALNDLAALLDLPEKASDRYERNPGEAPTGALSGASIAQSLNKLMPDHAIVVDEALSENLMFPKLTEGAAPFELLAGSSGGAIGGGPPLACGAAVACPDRKVILLEGDFSLMQGNTALWSMAQHNMDICVVNFNNGGSASLTTELARVRRGEAQPKSLELLKIREPFIDYAAMAASMGVPASRATTVEEFHEQFAEAMKTKGPHFIDAKIESVEQMIVDMHRKSYEALHGKT
jgi:acetolactate synthase-1/2/3 large subunit